MRTSFFFCKSVKISVHQDISLIADFAKRNKGDKFANLNDLSRTSGNK